MRLRPTVRTSEKEVAARAAVRRDIWFAPYRLDFSAGCLRIGERPIKLRPKTWQVLCHLAARPGVLVSKDELLDAVWPGIAVTEATITKSIGEIREALQDDVRRPRYVETVHRRGFRFVSAVDVDEPSPAAGSNDDPVKPRVVGRDVELTRLHGLLTAAASGRRQTAFITGEGGIGKTTLVEEFLASLADRAAAGEISIATGHCVRRHSGEEPLMPVLDALGRLARGPHAQRVVQLLRERAPAWLVQLPWLVDAGNLQELRATVYGTTPERMLRVFAQVVEALTADTTLILVLEDLHWADASTVDLIAVLAEQPEPARLLVLGTYRPAEVIVQGGAFDSTRRRLEVQGRSAEVPLRLLSLQAVEAFLESRFDVAMIPTELTRLLHAQTDGNPLFLATAADYLVEQGWIVRGDDALSIGTDLDIIERHVPGSLQELVEMQLLDLAPFEVSVLEAAAVAGLEFGAQTVAAALRTTAEEVEQACEALVRSRRFLRASDTEAWPDGAVAARYVFAHALYQRVLYHRIPAASCQRLHHDIGARLEAGFGARAADIAAELAAHFERSHDPARATPWLMQAGAAATRRFAPREGAAFFRRALRLLDHEPDGATRRQREFEINASLAIAAVATHGFAAEEARESLGRARELAATVQGGVDVFPILYMLTNVSITAGEATHARSLRAALAKSAEDVDTDDARLAVATLSANIALWGGQPREAAAFANVGAADAATMGRGIPGESLVVWALGAEGFRRWLVGEPDAARASACAAMACARALSNPVNLAMASFLGGSVYLWCGDFREAHAVIAEGRAVAAERGFELWSVALRSLSASLAFQHDAATAALAELQRAVSDLRRLGERVYSPALLVRLAEMSMHVGRVDEGLGIVDEALDFARTTLSQWQTPELWRVRGELMAARGDEWQDVESSFRRGIEIASAQHALALQLRSATALARHLRARGLADEARTVLAPVYDAFREGRDTADQHTARRLLDDLRP